MRLLASLRLLLLDPAAWSARHYARKNRMDLVALKPDAWPPRRVTP